MQLRKRHAGTTWELAVLHVRRWRPPDPVVCQPFVKDPDVTVGKLLDQAGASVKSFYRLEVGEGIEKKIENFAEEVKAQINAQG